MVITSFAVFKAVTLANNKPSKMFKYATVILSLIACISAKPGVFHAPLAAAPLAVAAPAPIITATSSQVVARTHNGIAHAPVIAAAPLAAPLRPARVLAPAPFAAPLAAPLAPVARYAAAAAPLAAPFAPIARYAAAPLAAAPLARYAAAPFSYSAPLAAPFGGAPFAYAPSYASPLRYAAAPALF